MLMITAVSIFQKECKRRKTLEALKDGEKQIDELMTAAGYKSKSHARRVLRGMLKAGYVMRRGSYNVAYWKITEKGMKFLNKKSIEEVL